MSGDDPYDAQFDDPSPPPRASPAPGEVLKIVVVIAGVLLLAILIKFVGGL